MAEPRHEDPIVAARYRDLPLEEPSPALDDAIRAAARRAVHASPRSFSRRWAMPVSVAAVLVLAVGVTLRMQIEQPGIEYSVPDRRLEAPAPVASAPPAPAVPEAAPLKEGIESTMSYAQKPAPPTAARRSERAAARDSAKAQGSAAAGASGEPVLAKQERERKATAPAPFQPELSRSAPMESRSEASGALAPQTRPKASADTAATQAAPPPPPAASAPAPAQAPAAPPPVAATAPKATEELALQAPSARAKRATEPRAMGDMGLRASAVETPERKLERIAELRREGRHAEADEALTKFRREHPDFKIAPELWERVRPR